MLTPLFANDSTAATRQLVGERSGILAENTQSIDDFSREAEHLRQCVETLEKSNSTIMGTLTSQQRDTLSKEQIAEMLRKLTSVMTIDAVKLSADLKQIDQNNFALKLVVQQMRDSKSQCEAGLKRLENVEGMHEKSIQNLTTVRVIVAQEGIPPTCRDGSTLL
jgi:hypothetical protein